MGNLPRFVERKRLASAIAVSSAYTQFAIFAGPAMGGWLIANHGVESAFFSNVAGYAIYLCTIAFLRTPPDFRQPPPSGRSLWGDWIDGLRYIAGHHGISTVLTLMLAGDALSAALTNMLPAYAATILGLGVGGMTSLLSAAGLGATCAALWLAHGGAGRATPSNVLWAFLAVALAVAALMFANSLVVALAIMLLYGMAGEVRRTSAMSLLQIAVSEAQRGRLMSAQFLLQRVAGGVAALAVGSSAEISGLRAPMWIGAALCVGVWLIAWRRRARIAAAFTPAAARVA
jgi:predicted MFS family arabinose efflux permease